MKAVVVASVLVGRCLLQALPWHHAAAMYTCAIAVGICASVHV
jgi:hypothetical protein